MKMNCLIIDDEPVARKGLEEYVKDISFLDCIALCENPLKASSYLKEHTIDLIFLDIHMPKVTGIEFLRTLKNPPLIIFTTAYSEYAVEGYALDVVDYLMKPISFERFLKAAQKALEIFNLRKLTNNSRNESDYFFIKCESKFEKVLYTEVLYVEGLQNYVVIHTQTRRLITYITMTGIENQLPKDQFIKVHKSFIISVRHVRAIEGNELYIGDIRIPISRNLKEEVVNQILGNKLFKR
jgi:DNA-binding LytR/AlgR family response regulator